MVAPSIYSHKEKLTQIFPSHIIARVEKDQKGRNIFIYCISSSTHNEIKKKRRGNISCPLFPTKKGGEQASHETSHIFVMI